MEDADRPDDGSGPRPIGADISTIDGAISDTDRGGGTRCVV
jgi:hypothetical protein